MTNTIKTKDLRPVDRVSDDTKFVLINDQIVPLSVIATYLNPTAQPLDVFADGTVLMVEDGVFVDSGLRYDSDLNALVYDGKFIADEVEVSNETFRLSQRVSLSSFGTQLSINSALDNEKSIPVYTKYDETGSLGNFAQTIGAETPFTVQDDDSELFTGSQYTPPTTTGTSFNNALRGTYRFSEAGINARISVTAENSEGESLILFGTESYPYAEFVTSVGDTVVEFPGTIANLPGLIYTTVIETYDPVTKESSDQPLNILGGTGTGDFRAYLVATVQLRGEVALTGTGDVSSVGTSASGDLAIFTDAAAKTIESIGININQLVTAGDPVSELLNDAGYLNQVFHDSTLEGTGSSGSPLTVSDEVAPYTGAVPPPSTDTYWALNTVDRRSYTYSAALSKWVSRYESVVMQKRGRLNPSNYINIGEVTPSDVDKGLAGGINQLSDGLDYGTVIVAIAYVNGRDTLPANAEFELWVSDGTADKQLRATFTLADSTAPNGMAFPDTQFIMNHTDVYAIKYQGDSQVNDIVLTVYYEAVYDA